MARFRKSHHSEIRNDFPNRAVMSKLNSLLNESTDRDKLLTALSVVIDVKN